jgi:hypothetical protein
MLTVVVADYIVEIQLRLFFIAIFVAEASLENVIILKLNVGGRLVEAHDVDL